tara:strand:+ start:1010 stop:1906 length:897 start_codon:yes stop_codon:yes gene_type:complete
MKTRTRKYSLLTLAVVSCLTSLSGAAQQNADYSQALRELDIMSNIFEAASEQRRSNRDSLQISSFDEGIYLADQGMVFSFRMSSGRNFFRAININALPAEAIANLEIDMAGIADEISSEMRRVFPGQDFSMPFVSPMMPGMSDEQRDAIEEMSELIRDQQESIRDSQRELRDLQRRLRDEETDRSDIENRIAQTERDLEAETAQLEEQNNAYRAFMQEYQEIQEQQIAARNRQAENEIMATLCDYGATLRSLQNDEHVSIVLQNYTDNRDQVYVFDFADVASCSSAEQLLQSALSYQL